MSLVARVIRQFHEGREAVTLVRLVALPHMPTMGITPMPYVQTGGTPGMTVTIVRPLRRENAGVVGAVHVRAWQAGWGTLNAQG